MSENSILDPNTTKNRTISFYRGSVHSAESLHLHERHLWLIPAVSLAPSTWLFIARPLTGIKNSPPTGVEPTTVPNSTITSTPRSLDRSRHRAKFTKRKQSQEDDCSSVRFGSRSIHRTDLLYRLLFFLRIPVSYLSCFLVCRCRCLSRGKPVPSTKSRRWMVHQRRLGELQLHPGLYQVTPPLQVLINKNLFVDPWKFLLLV